MMINTLGPAHTNLTFLRYYQEQMCMTPYFHSTKVT